jgi:hypothetical protein
VCHIAPALRPIPGVSLSLTLAFHAFCGRRFWAGGHRTAALSFLRGFRPCAPNRERVLDEPASRVCNSLGFLPWFSCGLSASKAIRFLRQFGTPFPVLGKQDYCCNRGAPSCAGREPPLQASTRACRSCLWSILRTNVLELSEADKTCFSSGLDSSACLVRHSARASSSYSTKAGSGGLPMFAVDETIYRATFPNLRSSSSDFFLSRVRNPSTSRVAS